MVKVRSGSPQFETALRKERQLEGIAKAKAEGVYKGRKPSVDVAQVRALKSAGHRPSFYRQGAGHRPGVGLPGTGAPPLLQYTSSFSAL